MTATRSIRYSRHRGFTLVELMVTVAIVTIIAMIAIPAYTSQVQKSRRTEARTALLDLAAREERYMSTNSAYTASVANLGYAGSSWPVMVGDQYYEISVTAPTTTTFQAQAQPINAQAVDPCGTFTLDNTGAEGVTGTYTASTCWN